MCNSCFALHVKQFMFFPKMSADSDPYKLEYELSGFIHDLSCNTQGNKISSTEHEFYIILLCGQRSILPSPKEKKCHYPLVFYSNVSYINTDEIILYIASYSRLQTGKMFLLSLLQLLQHRVNNHSLQLHMTTWKLLFCYGRKCHMW